MTTFVLIHGASSDSWYWHLVAPRLREFGHEVIAPDLPSDQDWAGFGDYADAVAAPVGNRRDLIVVAQSMAGFVAPLVCDRLTVDLVVLVAAMVPASGESPAQWWDNTGYNTVVAPSRDGFDPLTMFFHDVAPEVVEEAMGRGERAQSAAPFSHPYAFDGWPDVPTRFLLCRQDRFFPADFLRPVVIERLGIVPDEMDSGHLPALAHPAELVERLESFRIECQKSDT